MGTIGAGGRPRARYPASPGAVKGSLLPKGSVTVMSVWLQGSHCRGPDPTRARRLGIWDRR